MTINNKFILTGLVASSVMLHAGMNTSFAEQTADTEYRLITADSVNFRSGPSTNYSSICKLNKGDKVEYIGVSGSWIKVKFEGKTGYVYGSYVGEYTSTSLSIKYVTASSLNVRKGASTSYSVIGTLSKGTKVEVISTSNGWSKIKYNGSVGYVSSKYLSNSIVEDNTTASPSATVDKVISLAKSLLGKPYVWAAEGPNSFDCSGYTYYVFKKAANTVIPRTSAAQSKYGTYVSKSNIKIGDLIFFDTSGVNDGNVSHVGIYIGNNEFIHCSSSKGKVVISQLNSSYYSKAYVNARRVL